MRQYVSHPDRRATVAGITKRTESASNKDGAEVDRLALRIQYGALAYREL